MLMNSYFWATPSGPINLIEGDKMPVKRKVCQIICDGNNYGQCDCDRIEADYWNALQAAKKSSVPIQDHERATRIIQESIGGNGKGPNAINPYGIIVPADRIYGPFTVEYRIEDACAHDSCPVDGMCEHCKEPVKVAILYDDTPEKDHDTVLKEFADKMSKQEDIPKNIQAVVNKRFWDMLDTPEKEESQEYSLQKEIDDAKEWELWRDFLYEVGRQRHLLHGEDFMSTRWEQMMDTLKKEFTITRKQ